MSNRNNDNDFNFDDDDDLFGDRRTADDFDFGEDDSDFPSPLADDFGSDDDTPDFDEEQEERGPNRTFVFLAILMILMFVIGLGAVLFLATRPTGPTDAELTGTFVVQFNSTQQAFLAQTQTQDAINVAATQTALLESVELTQQALLTAQAENAEASLLTQTAAAVALFDSLTQTALAQPTNTRPPTNTPTPEAQAVVPTDPPPELALVDAWATQVQFVTQQAAFDQEVFATQAAYATQIGASGQNPEAEAQINAIIQSTAAALGTQASSVQIAIIAVDNALSTEAARNPDFATQFAQIAPIGQATQTALAEFVILPTASPTPVASGIDVDGKRNMLLRFPVNARGIFDPDGSQPEQIAPTPAAFSTAAAIATQSALATRQALIDRLLGTIQPVASPTNSLDSVNATATAIANAFISATQTAAAAGVAPITPSPSFGTIVPTPEALPDTGLFDDIGVGDNVGILALMVLGLVGVVFVSRRLRTTPATKDAIDGQ